jgi:hypothetical protein
VLLSNKHIEWAGLKWSCGCNKAGGAEGRGGIIVKVIWEVIK